MHIPDGYLSPATAGSLYAVMVPFWYAASRKLKRYLSGRTVPLMALMSAFCFVIQMINVPLPGGTTGHAVGSSLAAIVLGPWAAVLSVSITLVIQALFFADGGVTALGANCFNMAVVQGFLSYYIYRTISVRACTPRSKGLAAGVAGYISLNFAALLAGIELGLQPLIAHKADGTPLYAPYGLSVSVPAMVMGHLVAGFAEAVLSGAAVAYLHRSAPELLRAAEIHLSEPSITPLWARLRALWVALGILIILTPLGLLAPGTAWGEWASGQFRNLGLGFVPEGLQRWETMWSGIFSDYSIPGLGRNSGYIVSAILGVALILLVFQLLTVLGKRSAGRTGNQ